MTAGEHYRCQYAGCNIITDTLTDEYMCPLHDRRMWQVLDWLQGYRLIEQITSIPRYGPPVITRQEYRQAIETQLSPNIRRLIRRKDPPQMPWPAMETAILRAVATNEYQLSAPTPATRPEGTTNARTPDHPSTRTSMRSNIQH